MPTKTTAAGRASSGAKSPNAKSTGKNLKSSTTTATKTVGQMRTDLDIDHFRTLLIEERKRMQEELEQVRNRSTDMDNALPEEGEGGDEDTADLASAMMDKEMDLSVEDELEDILNQVDRAFQKIEEGTYGICDVSGQPIPKSRLELIPFATLTVECQAMAES